MPMYPDNVKQSNGYRQNVSQQDVLVSLRSAHAAMCQLLQEGVTRFFAVFYHACVSHRIT
jgi:hypothetical protein